MCKIGSHWTQDLLNKFITKALLNDEEVKIMYCVAKNLSNKEIAERLSVSVSTVSRRIKALKEKYRLMLEHDSSFPTPRD